MTNQAFVLSTATGTAGRAVSRMKFASIVQFADYVRTSPAVVDKFSSRAVVGATFAGNERNNDNLTSCNAVTLDFDAPLDGQLDAVCALLESEGISHVAHGTWSNHGRFAVIIPFAYPTDLMGHQVAIEDMRTRLGAYSNFAAESGRPGQLRFVSPNPQYSDRIVREFTGELYTPPRPATAITEAPLAPLATVTPIRSFESLSEVSSPAHKSLFLLALRNNLVNADRLDDYGRWQPVLFAAFRAWGIGITPNLIESQIELLETLNAWSALHPKFKPGCVEAKLEDYKAGRQPGNALHIHSLIVKETDLFGLREAIKEVDNFDEAADMGAALEKLIGRAPVLISPEALKASMLARHKRAAEDDAINLRALTCLSRLPKVNDRFSEFTDLLISFATQGQATAATLSETEWPYFLRPAPIVLAFAQLAAMGFAPHVLFRLSPAIAPKALNLYSVGIAKAGTGKSATLNLLSLVLGNTVFKNSICDAKLHSATGLWTNYIEKKGNIVIVVNDEAESLIGKNAQVDQHLAALHTFLKQAFDGGIPGRKSRPSAQVQREMQEVSAVTISMHLSATPVLLSSDVSKNMLSDGFMSRVIVTIDERDIAESSREAKLDAKMKLMDTQAEAGLDVSVPTAVHFFNKLWRDGKHPAGEEFFTIMPDTPPSDLAAQINGHFERTDLPVRYVTPPHKLADRRRFADIGLRATERWVTPKGMAGTDIEAGVDSLRVRAETKVFTLATIMSLIADPLATEVNLDIMEWCEEFLYVVQYGFYQHLIQSHDNVSMLPTYKTNPSFVDTLRPAVRRGGILFEGPADSKMLAEFSPAWRLVVNTILNDASEEGRAARSAMETLGITYTSLGNSRGCTFSLKPR